jgi:hypothetical protein
VVSTKFIIEVVLVVVVLAIVLYWLFTNYSTIKIVFEEWIKNVMKW